MPEIKLPSGATVTLKDVADIKHRDRKKLYSGVSDDLSTFDRGYVIMDNLLTIAVEAWSFDTLPPSVKRESLDDLSPEDYDALSEGAKPILDALFPASREDDTDPKADTNN
jgi:hypothetical protein